MYSFAGEAEDRVAVVEKEFEPCPLAHLGEIDAAKKESRDQMADSDIDRGVPDGGDRLVVSFGAV